MVTELHAISPVKGQSQVYYPGEISQIHFEKAQQEGVLIPKAIIDYLESETLHFDRYGSQDSFAK